MRGLRASRFGLGESGGERRRWRGQGEHAGDSRELTITDTRELYRELEKGRGAAVLEAALR